MSKTFEPPYRRFAIRFTKDGNVSWWTDDGTGCDDARDYTEWDPKRLVVHVDRDDAIREVEALRKFARARGMTVAVVPVWEYPGGTFELTKRRTADGRRSIMRAPLIHSGLVSANCGSLDPDPTHWTFTDRVTCRTCRDAIDAWQQDVERRLAAASIELLRQQGY
jgi:hypothetical protein